MEKNESLSRAGYENVDGTDDSRQVLNLRDQLEEAQIEMLERLALASELRDDDTGEHTRRVGELSARIARLAGWPEAELDLVRRAAALHDIGKIGIPDRVLLKPGKLTPEEFELIKTHTALGSRMLAGSRFRVIQLAEQVAQYHHEKWNGTGYLGLSGEAIPLVARIVALADVFDVLTHARPYKAAWPVAEALTFIERESARHFDPSLVRLLLQFRTWLLPSTCAYRSAPVGGVRQPERADRRECFAGGEPE